MFHVRNWIYQIPYNVVYIELSVSTHLLDGRMNGIMQRGF